MRKQLLIRNAVIMTAASLLMRSAGLLTGSFLASQMGSQALGIRQLQLSVFSFFALAAVSGTTITVTRISGELIAQGKHSSAASAAKMLLLIFTAFGTLIGAAMSCFSDVMADIIFHENDFAPALRVLAVCIGPMAFSSVIRGWFSARRKIGRITIEQFIEQITETGFCVASFLIIHPQNTGAMCCLSAAGSALAELVSMIYSLFIFRSDIRKYDNAQCSVISLLKRAAPIFLPCTANSALRSGLSAAENLLIPAGLIAFGAVRSDALSQYGQFSAMAMPVIIFPSVFVMPFATLIIPEMAQARTLGHTNNIRYMTGQVFSAVMRYSVPVMAMLFFFGNDISALLYGDPAPGRMIRALAPVVPLMYIDSCADGILKGLDRQTDYFICNLIDSIIRVFLAYLLIPLTGIDGVIAIIIISELLNTLLSLWQLIKASKIQINLKKDILLPLTSAVVPCMLLSSGITDIPFMIKAILSPVFYVLFLFLLPELCHSLSKKHRPLNNQTR